MQPLEQRTMMAAPAVDFLDYQPIRSGDSWHFDQSEKAADGKSTQGSSALGVIKTGKEFAFVELEQDGKRSDIRFTYGKKHFHYTGVQYFANGLFDGNRIYDEALSFPRKLKVGQTYSDVTSGKVNRADGSSFDAVVRMKVQATDISKTGGVPVLSIRRTVNTVYTTPEGITLSGTVVKDTIYAKKFGPVMINTRATAKASKAGDPLGRSTNESQEIIVTAFRGEKPRALPVFQITDPILGDPACEQPGVVCASNEVVTN